MDAVTLILLCVFAFTAGFVDAIAGGGGLIQTPAALVLLPNYPVSSVIASLKIPSLTGTSLAAGQYLRRVKIHLPVALLMCSIAFAAAFAGSELLTIVSNRFMKPAIFFILVAVAVYTYSKKHFGEHTTRQHSRRQQLLYSCGISLVVGFYDGFIGPGAGSFLILGFIALLGFDFLHASAHAKLVNIATNCGSITLFLLKGAILWPVAIPMAVCNGAGGVIGARVAVAKGNRFIRVFFLCIVTATLLRLGWDIFIRR